jgi:hypothetical protein
VRRRRRMLIVYAVAAVALALAAMPSIAIAGKGGNGGGKGGGNRDAGSASIAFHGGDGAYAAGDEISFWVSEPANKSYWVANLCRQDGSVIYEEYLPVSNVDNPGVAGAFHLSFSGAAECTAYAWEYPDAYTPVSGASMDYSVSG